MRVGTVFFFFVHSAIVLSVRSSASELLTCSYWMSSQDWQQQQQHRHSRFEEARDASIPAVAKQCLRRCRTTEITHHKTTPKPTAPHVAKTAPRAHGESDAACCIPFINLYMRVSGG